MNHSRTLTGMLVAAALALGGCNGAPSIFSEKSLFPSNADTTFARGKMLVEKGNVEGGLAEVEKAMKAEPRNSEYRVYIATVRASSIATWLTEADAARTRGDAEAAAALYNRTLRMEPNNDRARNGLDEIRMSVRHEAIVREAAQMVRANRLEDASSRLRLVLSENGSHVEAQNLRREISARMEKARLAAGDGLGPAFRRPLTLEFRDANLRAIFDVLARTSGINFVFDRDVRPDLRSTIFLKDTTIEEAMNLLIATNQLDKRVLNSNTVLVYPNAPAKQKEYQELTVRTFYLANAEAKSTANMIRTIVRTRDIFIDDKLNMVTIRDTPDAVRIAERLVAAQDLPEPEVVLELEVLEVNSSRLRDLGVVFPNQFTVLNIVPSPTTITTLPGGQTVTTPNLTTTTTQLTLEQIRGGVGTAQIGINSPQLNARAEIGDSNILANPRIRVKNREKARVHIGDKVPVITTTSTANVGVSEAVNYLDVGIKLDVEPTIFLDSDVSIRVSLEVSNIVREVTSRTGTLTYQLGTRNASTVLRLRDNETQVLAGLISDEDRRSAVRIPWLGELPMIGKLFGTNRTDVRKSEIVLLMTPRVVRNIPTLEASAQQFPAGTESQVGARPFNLRPGATIAVPMGAGGAPSPGAGPDIEVEPAALPPLQPPAPPAAPAAPAAPASPAVPGAPPVPGAAPAGAARPVSSRIVPSRVSGQMPRRPARVAGTI